MTTKYDNPCQLAIFESAAKYTYQVIYTPEEGKISGFARVSEWTSVSFPSLSQETILQEKIACLDKEMEQIRKEALEKLDKLNERKQELLALPFTHPSNAGDPQPLDDFRS